MGDLAMPSSGQTGFFCLPLLMILNFFYFIPFFSNFVHIYRPTLLLENYQPWLDLKIPSKVDASLSEVIDIFVKHAIILK